MEPLENNTLASKILAKLSEAKLSPRAASIKAGLSPDAIRNILRNPDSSPRGKTLERLAAVLNLDAHDLLPSLEKTHHEGIAEGIEFGGEVQAGAFRAANYFDQDAPRLIPLAADVRFPPSEQIAFKVFGDSMDLAGVTEGMWVVSIPLPLWEAKYGLSDKALVVVQQSHPSGQERELTIKRLRVFRDRLELWPESTNSKHKHLTFHIPAAEDEDRQIEIIGVVLAATQLFGY